MFVGRSGEWDTEGSDLLDIRLPGRQDELVSAVAAANPRTRGGAADRRAGRDAVAGRGRGRARGLVSGAGGGQRHCRRAARLAEPGGRLPQSFPVRWNDNPVHSQDREIYPGLNGKVRYEEGVFIGYRHYDRTGIEPMFPFGFGLSYTSFEVSDLAIDETGFDIDGKVTAWVGVTNTGARRGSEVVQLYVGDEASSVPRPVKELKAFEKVTLEPGEGKRLRFDLSARDFAFFDVAGHRWLVEPGAFNILIGTSATDIKLSAQVRRTTTMVLPV